MRVLVACEMSGRVRDAFRRRGHDAWSCDLLPALDNSPFHIIGNVLNHLDDEWDLMVAHPPCTYLCNSGVRWLWKTYKYSTEPPDAHEELAEYKRTAKRWRDMEEASDFFWILYGAPIPKIVVENPIPHRYADLPKYSQTIQPYQFGDDASKKTCLWLKGLPKLVIPPEDEWVQPHIVDGKPRWANQTDSGQNKEPPSVNRGLLRSLTYPGIANALAEQYG